MTSDGVVVVTHDSNLKRCTGKNAKVYDLTYAEVAQLDAGRWFSSRFADTRIPTLEQVLQLCRGRIGLNVEIKPSAATPALEAETVRLLREYGFDSSNCVITSQSYETLHKVKALAPEYPTGYILALGVGNYYDLPDADFFSVETTFITSYYKRVVFIDRSPAGCYNNYRVLWIGLYHLPSNGFAEAPTTASLLKC